MSKKKEYETCFYCNATISTGSGHGDHFPIPKSAGGKLTVPCCLSCHDMKDRFNPDSHDINWDLAIWEDFHKVGHETKIFLAQCLAMAHNYRIQMIKINNKAKHLNRKIREFERTKANLIYTTHVGSLKKEKDPIFQ